MKNNKKITLATLSLILSGSLLVGCSNKAKSSDDYKKEEITRLEKSAKSDLKDGKMAEAAVYYDLLKDANASGVDSMIDSLKQWKDADSLATEQKYDEALRAFKNIKSDNTDFNRALTDKISKVNKLYKKQDSFTDSYNKAKSLYDEKKNSDALKELNKLLKDDTITDADYSKIFQKVSQLYAKIVDSGNSSSETSSNTTNSSSSSSTSSTNNSAAGENAPTKDSSTVDGQQVTEKQIEDARAQLKDLGQSPQYYSGADITKLINISKANGHNKITQEDVDQFLKPKN